MPNPDDGCYDCTEWIEIMSYENVSLDNITIYTGETPVILNGSLGSNNYIIITRNRTIFSRIWNFSGNIIESKSMSLKNSGDNITIYNNSVVIDNIEYFSCTKNVSYGICNGTIIAQNISTPGRPNTCFVDNSTNNMSNQTNSTIDTCDFNLWIESEDVFYEGSNKYWLRIDVPEGETAAVEYWIEDLFGDIVKSMYTTNSPETARKWTPPETFGSEAYVIHANLTNISCNDTSVSNNYYERMIVVKGKNQIEEDEPCEPVNCDCPPCSCSPCNIAQEKETNNDFEIVSYPESIGIGEEMKIIFKIINSDDTKKECEIYSYVYSGNKLLSLGLNGNKWNKEWSANKKTIDVSADNSSIITLFNMISDDTKLGEYSLRIRTICDGKKRDFTEKISVKEYENVELSNELEPEKLDENIEMLDNNKSDEDSEIRIPTAEIISDNSDNIFAYFIENVVNFFKNILNL